MTKKELYARLTEYFEQAMPHPTSELDYTNNFELLVAVMLSAQCTDKRVNMVTPALFRAYPTPERMAEAEEVELLELIRSVSYPNSKAAHLRGMARMLVADFGGEVPSTLEELTRLPGVGRKTANVVQAIAFGKAAMAVDTHIFRVSHRMGLVSDRCTTPLSVERELTRWFDEKNIPDAHHWLLLHGRYTCTARAPKCVECKVKLLCKLYKREHAAK